MPSTKTEAIKEAKKLLKKFPSKDVIVLDHTANFPKGNGLRWNYRFQNKKGSKNKLRFKKEVF